MNILITGAGSDITIACNDYLTKQGHKVITTSHSGNPNSLGFDLSDPQKSEDALNRILAQGLDAVVLNAASQTYRLATFEKIDFADADRFLRDNIQGNIWLLQKLIAHFRQQKFGRIIFVSSATTELPVPGYSMYAGAKSAMETMIKYVGIENGEFNITANTLRLGIFETERNKKFVSRPSIKEKMLSKINLKRLGTPRDLFLILETLLDKDSYIQGSTIDVNGGTSFPS